MRYNIESNTTPIYIQLVNQIKVEILAGRLKPGARLPSVRDFSFELKVNPNTLQRALGELEGEGLIYTERTNGKYITDDEKLILRCRKKYADELTREYKRKLKEIGL